MKESLFYRFLERRESPYYTAIFRILVSFFLLLYIFFIRSSILDLYGKGGFMNWAATKSLRFKYSLKPETVHDWLRGFGMSEDQTIGLLFGLFLMCCLLLLTGLFTRIAAIIAWLLNLVLIYTSKGTTYGVHSFIHIALFYLALMPSNRVLSLDSLMFRLRKDSVRAYIRHLLQIHMVIMYASSGLEKAVGVQWWNGEAIWRALNMGHYMQYDMSWLAYYPFIPITIGIGTLIVEIGYMVIIWIPRIRVVWLLLIILLHTFIGLFMGLHLFALLLIIMNLGAFGPEAYKDMKAYRRKNQ